MLFAALILSTTACKTREVGSSPSVDGELVFSDDFERDGVGPSWERGTGEGGQGHWTIREGRLHASGLRNDPLWYVEELPEKVRVEFDAEALSTAGDLKVEMFGDGETHATGYIFIFGGWNNSLDVIARLDEHGKDRLEQPARKAERGRNYAMAIERRGGDDIKWFVDGKLFMTYSDDAPLRGEGHRHFAFNNWNAPVAFDNFRVFELP